MADFEYFYGQEADLFSFIRVPKLLFTDDRFKDLSSDAKILYGLLLDRMSLSVEKRWFDKYGRVFIIYTIAEIVSTLGCANTKACNTLKQLIEAGLVEKENKGQGKAQLIYVKKILKDYSGHREKHSNYKNSQNQNSEKQNSHNDSSRIPESRTVEISKSECINTENNNTDFSNTDINSISSNLIRIYPPAFMSKDDGMRRDERRNDSLSDIAKIKNEVLSNIEAGSLYQRFPHNAELVDQIAALITDVISGDAGYYVIGGAKKNPELVKEQFRNINYSHVAYVIDSLKRNTTEIRNVRQYLITALYNAPLTIDAHYESQVNHDLKSGIFLNCEEETDEQRNSLRPCQPERRDREDSEYREYRNWDGE